MPKPYPREFRENVVRVARARVDGTTLKQVARDFGLSESCLTNWIAIADRQGGGRPAAPASESSELRDANHRRRRQARRGGLTPIEYETIMTTPTTQAA